MILRLRECRGIHGLHGCVALGIALILAIASAAPLYSAARWDRKAARRALEHARQLRESLSESPNPSTTSYFRCAQVYESVYLNDPHYGGSDDAVYEEGTLFQEMGDRFKYPEYYKTAVKLFRFLLSDYPLSPLCPDALLRVGDLNAGPLEREKAAQEAYQLLRTRYKSSKAALILAARQKPATLAEDLGAKVADGEASPTEASMTTVTNIRHWSTSDYTRVIIDTDAPARYAKGRLADPERIFFDIANAKLSTDLLNKTFRVGDEFLKRIRVGQNRLDVVRVVLDFGTIGDFNVFELHDPFRIVVDIHGRRSAQIKSKSLAESMSQPSERSVPPKTVLPRKADEKQLEPTPSPASKVVGGIATPTKTEETGQRVTQEQKKTLAIEELQAPPPRPTPSAGGSAPPSKAGSGTSGKSAEVVSPTSATPHAPSPKPAAPTSRGDRTLTRVLGLKIGRIVLDPGHGGQDTGTIGRGGLLEKDLVLEIAKALQKLLEDKLGAEVVLTRQDDTFVPLEERTAIANQSVADLFLSIHANSSSSRSTSGAETYYLDFARTASDREVAARENAATVRNVRDLQDLIKKIAQADKLAESRELATTVQRLLFAGSRKLFPSARNRGVRSAPFVVLIGANMPSVLTEIAFISNPRDERALRKEDSQQILAGALLSGIEAYAKTLGTSVAQNRADSGR